MNAIHERMLKYFTYEHLSVDLQAVSKPMCDLARAMVDKLEASNDPAEVTVGLRKLMEAKDCFVRAMLTHL